MKIKLKCLSCGGEGESNCCDNPKLVKASEYAAQAIAEHPEMSDRSIADKIGVNQSTVSRARKTTDANASVEKRIGRDGKKRKQPTRQTKISEAVEIGVAHAVLDGGHTLEATAEAFGLNSVQPVKIAVAKEQGRRDAPIDASTLPQGAQEKVQRAIKQAIRKLEAEYELRVQAGIKQAIEDTVLPHYNKKMDEFDEVVKSRNGVLTADEFRLILSCLHPDQSATPERLREAFNTFKSHELTLRGEKEMPTSSFIMPRTYTDLMKMKEEVRAKRKAQRHTAKNLPGIN